MSSRLQRLLRARYRISTQLYAAIGGAVAMTIAASLVGWLSFSSVGDAQRRVNENSLPETEAASGVAQSSSSLAAAAPQLTAAATEAELAAVTAQIDEDRANLKAHLEQLEETASVTEGERLSRIRDYSERLDANIEAMKSEVAQAFVLAERREVMSNELASLRLRLDNTLVPAIDDQLFYTMTGYRTLGFPPAPEWEHFSEAEVARFRHLADLQANANIATQLLASAFTLSDSSAVEPLRERFESAQGRVNRSLSALQDSLTRAILVEIFAELFNLGLAEGQGLDLIKEGLALTEQQVGLLDLNRDVSEGLVKEATDLVGAAGTRTEQATAASAAAISRGRYLLLGISAASVIGAVLIAWLFVGRSLLRRLEMLAVWMRRMAGGELEVQAEIGGRDEVAEMGAALEVFRRRSLEAQRLNLVERLASELQGKNDELEKVLEDLQRAQNQIVMREKLAELGQLTAGVAHEIKNPLNFVMNFSQVSKELLEELQETLAEGEEGAALSADQRSLIEEISQDLSGNLERIRTHGNRANRIVQDMLAMGRGGGGHRQMTDINYLLDEHARLAYHSARATDNEFQLDLKEDLDQSVGEIEVVTQDIGRVFLNMVTNACYATNEKRRELVESGNGASYMPTVWLTTKRDDGTVYINIKDNGKGIPPDVVDKIFNPFFTTKPTDQGTGLGLSICNDIVRQHGGAIAVSTEPGEFTEMAITLPLEAPPAGLPQEAAAAPDPVQPDDDDDDDDVDADGDAEADAEAAAAQPKSDEE